MGPSSHSLFCPSPPTLLQMNSCACQLLWIFLSFDEWCWYCMPLAVARGSVSSGAMAGVREGNELG